MSLHLRTCHAIRISFPYGCPPVAHLWDWNKPGDRQSPGYLPFTEYFFMHSISFLLSSTCPYIYIGISIHPPPPSFSSSFTISTQFSFPSLCILTPPPPPSLSYPHFITSQSQHFPHHSPFTHCLSIPLSFYPTSLAPPFSSPSLTSLLIYISIPTSFPKNKPSLLQFNILFASYLSFLPCLKDYCMYICNFFLYCNIISCTIVIYF